MPMGLTPGSRALRGVHNKKRKAIINNSIMSMIIFLKILVQLKMLYNNK
jgi:hypothetical protein